MVTTLRYVVSGTTCYFCWAEPANSTSKARNDGLMTRLKAVVSACCVRSTGVESSLQF